MAMYDSSGREVRVQACKKCGHLTNKDCRCEDCGQWYCGQCSADRLRGEYRCPKCQSSDKVMRWQMT